MLPEGRSGDRLLLGTLALATVLLHLPFLGQYGYHGDELYFLSCGARPDFGYVDHAPLVPLLAAAVDGLFPDSLIALRLLPLLAGAATVVLCGLLARELGGGRFAMGAAALAVMLGPFFARTASMFAIPSFEPVYWSLASLVLVRLLQQGRPRLWIAFGSIAGIGLLNKHTMLLYGFAVTLALLLTGHRRQAATRWFWTGGALAALLFLPNVIWQIAHDWPTWHFARRLNETTMAAIPRVDFLLGQVLYAGPQNALLWIPGLVFLLRRRTGACRVLGLTFVVVVGVLLVVQSKIYYSLPIYPVVFAAGAVFWERILRSSVLRATLIAILVLGGGMLLPLSVPMMPMDETDEFAAHVTFGLADKVHEITGDLHYMFGWEDIAAGVVAAYEALPPEDRARCVILVGNYSRAGALERFGPASRLPPILCNFMSWHFWTTRYLEQNREAPRNGDVLLYLGETTGGLERLYGHVEEVAPVPVDESSFDQGLSVYLCRDPREPLADRWPDRPFL